jgi:hypothetical protein
MPAWERHGMCESALKVLHRMTAALLLVWIQNVQRYRTLPTTAFKTQLVFSLNILLSLKTVHRHRKIVKGYFKRLCISLM